MNRSPTRMRVATLGALLVALAVAMEFSESRSSLSSLRDGFGPEGGPSGRSVRLLEELGIPAAPIGWTGLAADAPSSRAVSGGDLVSGQWLVSIAIPEESLHDPEHGILTHREGRGRDWERVAWLSVYDGRRLAFATRVGLRVHGGSSRTGSPREAFRVIFRSAYGLPHLPASGPLATAARPPDRFVIRRSQVMPQTQPLAFAIATRIGAVAPAAESVRFVMNGSLRRQAYELTEHVSREGWGRAFFGHDDFRLFQFRGTSSQADAAAYDDLREWIAHAPAPLLLSEAAERVDVDLFIRHILTIMYCGTDDWAQGGAVLDLRSPRRAWFWVLWDLDQSFRDLGSTPWTRSSVSLLADPERSNEQSDVRARLFTRLIREDPSFVRRFTGVVAETFNHRLTQDYLQALAWRHSELSVREVPFNGFALSRFFERRGEEVFADVARTLGQPGPYYVGVEAPGDVRLEIDGYEHSPPYLGRYLDGQVITVRAFDGEGRPKHGWDVNGHRSNDERLEIVVDREILIRLES